jgi:hypothetical protein
MKKRIINLVRLYYSICWSFGGLEMEKEFVLPTD